MEATHFIILKQTQRKYQIEIIYRPSVLDNIKQWRVFEDDLEIKRFLELTGDFSNSLIDHDQDDDVEDDNGYSENKIVGHKIIELKGNLCLKVWFPLKGFFQNMILH